MEGPSSSKGDGSQDRCSRSPDPSRKSSPRLFRHDARQKGPPARGGSPSPLAPGIWLSLRVRFDHFSVEIENEEVRKAGAGLIRDVGDAKEFVAFLLAKRVGRPGLRASYISGRLRFLDQLAERQFEPFRQLRPHQRLCVYDSRTEVVDPTAPAPEFKRHLFVFVSRYGYDRYLDRLVRANYTLGMLRYLDSADASALGLPPPIATRLKTDVAEALGPRRPPPSPDCMRDSPSPRQTPAEHSELPARRDYRDPVALSPGPGSAMGSPLPQVSSHRSGGKGEDSVLQLPADTGTPCTAAPSMPTLETSSSPPPLRESPSAVLPLPSSHPPSPTRGWDPLPNPPLPLFGKGTAEGRASTRDRPRMGRLAGRRWGVLLVGLMLVLAALVGYGWWASPGPRFAAREGVIIARENGFQLLEGPLDVGSNVSAHAAFCYENCLLCACGRRDPLSLECAHCPPCYAYHWDCSSLFREKVFLPPPPQQPLVFAPSFICNCSGNTVEVWD